VLEARVTVGFVFLPVFCFQSDGWFAFAFLISVRLLAAIRSGSRVSIAEAPGFSGLRAEMSGFRRVFGGLSSFVFNHLLGSNRHFHFSVRNRPRMGRAQLSCQLFGGGIYGHGRGFSLPRDFELSKNKNCDGILHQRIRYTGPGAGQVLDSMGIFFPHSAGPSQLLIAVVRGAASRRCYKLKIITRTS